MNLAIHVHTNYSACSESPIEEIAKYCIESGIDAIAITDHDLVEGAFKLQEYAPDLKVIIGEEISTREGEVIGLFLNKRIEPARELRWTCEQIKKQGGLVYVPHPFDKFKVHRVRSYHLRSVLDLVDIIEIFNAKISFGHYNRKARRYAEEHGIIGAVGSDSHYVKSIGSALNIIEPFTDAQDFLEKLAHAQFKTGAASLLSTWWVRARRLARAG